MVKDGRPEKEDQLQLIKWASTPGVPSPFEPTPHNTPALAIKRVSTKDAAIVESHSPELIETDISGQKSGVVDFLVGRVHFIFCLSSPGATTPRPLFPTASRKSSPVALDKLNLKETFSTERCTYYGYRILVKLTSKATQSLKQC